MSLNTQVNIYSIDTSAFYNEKELKIHKTLSRYYSYRNAQKQSQKSADSKFEKLLENRISIANRRIKYLKQRLYDTFSANKNIRDLDEQHLQSRNVVSVFESSLTRTIGIKPNEINRDILIVQAYFLEIIEDIILNGFALNGEKYMCFTASAGQIRTKKTLFIKESIWNQYERTLMCGLTKDKINQFGGANTNKYLAYLALCNSATDEWKDFDIRKCIVVDDMELDVRGLVDFIDDKTYEITRKNMDVPLNITDGCGMILPSKSKKCKIIRAPWLKGLLVPFDFSKFLHTYNSNTKGTQYGMVTDIFGKKHDIVNDDIEIIFTKSQFKMYGYYTSWKQYVDYFLEYGCHVGECSVEEDVFDNAKINYQMLQTLTDITCEELEIISESTKERIINIGRDKKTKLKVLGVTKANTNKNNLQQAIEIYEPLMRDVYSKEVLKSVKKSLVKEGRSGKIEIDGKYTFIAPDLYAFCEWLFLGIKQPQGLLKDGEVFCKIYKDKSKLDCLRSPHLFREHAVRNNVVNSERSEWFITNALYTSCHDMIGRILQNDFDGDSSLVVADETIIKVAERNMKGIVPLYYNMAKAGCREINNRNIYEGLKNAYTGGNIGVVSNYVTKIWNSGDVNLDAIKILCMEGNFLIDYAKTLYKPTRPPHIDKLIKEYTKAKVPHFFIYAKDKHKRNVEKTNDSVVNRLEKIIPNPRINFQSDGLGKFDYKNLMRDKYTNVYEDIVKKYTELDLKKHFMVDSEKDKKANEFHYQYQEIKKSILEINPDVNYVTDVLVEYLYGQKNSKFKTTLWECFGDVIVQNLKMNVGFNKVYCDGCGDLIEKVTNNQKYCKECWKEKQKELDREYQRKKYNSRVSEQPKNR